MEGVYPIVYTHFLKKKILHDSIMNKYMLKYKENTTYASFGIEELMWRKIQKGGGETETGGTDPEPPLIKQALKILTSMPTKALPQEKSECLDDIFQLFNCNREIDHKISLLAYLLVRSAGKGVQWSAEIDYISTFSNVDCSLLLSIRMFFLTSWMQQRNGIFYVDMVGSLEASTILDIKCLWQDLKKDKKTAYLEIDLLHSMFFECAHSKFSESKLVTLKSRFSERTLQCHFMKNIVERLQLEITPNTNNNGCTVKFGDFVDCSVLSRITSSFVELNLDMPLE